MRAVLLHGTAHRGGGVDEDRLKPPGQGHTFVGGVEGVPHRLVRRPRRRRRQEGEVRSPVNRLDRAEVHSRRELGERALDRREDSVRAQWCLLSAWLCAGGGWRETWTHQAHTDRAELDPRIRDAPGLVPHVGVYDSRRDDDGEVHGAARVEGWRRGEARGEDGGKKGGVKSDGKKVVVA